MTREQRAAPLLDTAHRLIEKGFTDEAVAGYGTSVENAAQIFLSGIVPPYPFHRRTLEYQRVLAKQEEYLYYAFPFIGNFRATEKPIRDMLFQNYGPDITPHQIMSYELATHKVLGTLQRYAHYQAVRDAFNHSAGAELATDEVFLLAAHDVNSGFQDLKKAAGPYANGYWDYSECEVTQTELDELYAQITPKKVHECLVEAMKRRGTILFFNREFFSSGKVYAGIEDEGEVFVVTPQRLDLSVISGISCYSSSDLDALMRLMQHGKFAH